MRIVIVGGVAGGMSAATRLRRLNEHADIIVCERSGHVSFANCGLPYHVGGVIEDRDALLLQTPDSLGARFGIDVRVHTEVTAIDPVARTVTLVSAGTEEDVSYDALVLSPGAKPLMPPIPGIEHALALRNVEDLDAILAASQGASRAVVIGGGFIGVEMAENLVKRGMSVELIEAQAQILAPLDPEMASPVRQRMAERGVRVRVNTAVTEIGRGWVACGEERLEADLVIAALGVRPDVELARAAGLEIGERGGIVVDENLRTSDPNIYAIGDAVEKVDAIDGSQTLIPLAQTANRQGRRVADVISGHPVSDHPVAGTAIVGVFGLQVASVGWNEKRLRAAGRDYRAIHTHPMDHAGYYPGASALALKLLVDPATDEILGAQAVGESGADKRIDVISVAMYGGLKARDLAELELAYAPQFGSAKDPVNFLGWIDENLHTGLTESIQWHEVPDAQAAGATIIDVRTPAEHEAARIDGSILIPLDDLRSRLDELPAGDMIIHCAVGLRGYLATRLLEGYRDQHPHWGRIRNLDGGMKTWTAGRNA